MGEYGEVSGAGAVAAWNTGFGEGGGVAPARLIPDIPVIDPWSGQNFQEHGPHTAYLRWLLQQPGDLSRYRPADFHPIIAKVQHAHFRMGGHQTSSMRRGGTRNAQCQINALILGLCCGWRAGDLGWTGSHAERALAGYCREEAKPHYTPEVHAALNRISAAGMMAMYEDACRFENWRDVEMLLMSVWRSGVSLVDEEGYLRPDWKSRFARAFAMRFPEIS